MLIPQYASREELVDMAELRVQRRLAAIVAADVVGYSRLMHEDEAGTLARLKLLRKELLYPKIDEFGGRVVKVIGDGVLIEFPSAVDAVQHAFDFQQALALRNADVPEDRRIQIRIGVNVGDVIVEDDDIYGDGVNIAARLEGLAEAGGVCVSGTVFDQVTGKLDIGFEDLGPQIVKNISEPVRTYRLELETSPTAKPAGLAAETDAAMKRPAVAVLPFTNISGEPEQEYFADGLTEDIITALSLWKSFPVIARNSTFSYKGIAVKVQQVAEELGARYVLEGSVRKAGNKVRITGQLIDADTGHHVWAQKFDRDLDDIFEVQDEITRLIAATVEPEIGRAEQQRSAMKIPANLDAWDCYQRGISKLNEHTASGIAEARKMFDQALALDPTYSKAYSGLSYSHTLDLLMELAGDRDQAIAKVLEYGKQAVALDPTDSVAHEMLSIGYMWPNQDDLSIAEARKALELNPSNSLAYINLGNVLDLTGETEEGISNLAKGAQLSPQDPLNHVYMTFLARAHITARRYDEAAAWARRAIPCRPDYASAHFILAASLAHQELYGEARTALDECERIHSGFVEKRTAWRPYRAPAANEHLLMGLRKVGLMN